jgi:hypothetical protein
MIAALYVQTDGCYFDIPDVDPYDQHRDARFYRGPHPVIAHPPCKRWGRYWSGGPSAKKRFELGDDNGCFAYALRHVREYGGVLEHPADSLAWSYFGLHKPPRSGGWVVADEFGGWTCCVYQIFYGHRAQKATWLYACKTDLPSLHWGKPKQGSGIRHPDGYHSAEERREAKKYKTRGVRERLSKRQRAATPIEFRDLLIDIAKSANQ